MRSNQSSLTAMGTAAHAEMQGCLYHNGGSQLLLQLTEAAQGYASMFDIGLQTD
jgi:hypothetical protein